MLKLEPEMKKNALKLRRVENKVGFPSKLSENASK